MFLQAPGDAGMSACLALLQRELRIAMQHRSQLIQALLFFVLVVVLFPLGSRPDMQLLREFAPAIIWVAALLASMLSLDRLFAADARDGTLEQLLLSPAPTTGLIMTKVLAHWLTGGALVVLLSPILGYALGLSPDAAWMAMASLALGTPVLILIGAIGAALTLNAGGGMLLALILLPLYIPVLIFGAHCIVMSGQGMAVEGPLYLLAALLVLAVTLAPVAITAALRISLED